MMRDSYTSRTVRERSENGAENVAYSIVTEALAGHSGRVGGRLRNRERVHERP